MPRTRRPRRPSLRVLPGRSGPLPPGFRDDGPPDPPKGLDEAEAALFKGAVKILWRRPKRLRPGAHEVASVVVLWASWLGCRARVHGDLVAGLEAGLGTLTRRWRLTAAEFDAMATEAAKLWPDAAGAR